MTEDQSKSNTGQAPSVSDSPSKATAEVTVPPPLGRSVRRFGQRLSDSALAYLLLAPSLIVFAVFMIVGNVLYHAPAKK